MAGGSDRHTPRSAREFRRGGCLDQCDSIRCTNAGLTSLARRDVEPASSRRTTIPSIASDPSREDPSFVRSSSNENRPRPRLGTPARPTESSNASRLSASQGHSGLNCAGLDLSSNRLPRFWTCRVRSSLTENPTFAPSTFSSTSSVPANNASRSAGASSLSARGSPSWVQVISATPYQ